MRKLIAGLFVFGFAVVAQATDLDVSVQTSDGLDYIKVGPGETVDYRIVGTLDDTNNEGLALFGLDLTFDGGDLPSADIPTTEPMDHFVRNLGITNPDSPCPPACGFGGTIVAGDLIQIGGGMNTINNTANNAPFPVGNVIEDLAKAQLTLVTGSFPAPLANGVYTLAVRPGSLFANVIKQGEVDDGTHWATVAAGAGTTTALTVEVNGVPTPCTFIESMRVAESAGPANCAVDARQPSNPDGTNPRGWQVVELTLGEANCDAQALSAVDFTVSSTDGVAPTIDSVDVVDEVVTLNLSGPIPARAWTCFEFNGGQQCLGFLPADINSDHRSTPQDVLYHIDCLNGVATCAKWQCDTDRSDACAPQDVLRTIDLLNGASQFIQWLNADIGDCPSD